METTQHEIIRVVQAAFLVNSARIACRYETADGKPLAPGYYFALWPRQATMRCYDPKVRYFGPFATPQEAQLVQSCACYLGLVAPPKTAPRAADAPRLTAPVRNAYAALLQALRNDRATRERCGARPVRPAATPTDSCRHGNLDGELK